MKIQIKAEPKVFTPININITCESLAELINLERRINISAFAIRNSDMLSSRTQYFKNYSCNTANQELWRELNKILIDLGM